MAVDFVPENQLPAWERFSDRPFIKIYTKKKRNDSM